MKKLAKQEPSTPRLKGLMVELEKVQKAKQYLDDEKDKLLHDEETVRNKINKEREIISLKNKIKRIKNRKV
jgi:hypothetical protein